MKYLIWTIAVIYAFVKWGFWHGLVNIIIPYALAYDIVKKLLEIL